MTPDQLHSIQGLQVHPCFYCVSCDGAATCPMLEDETWRDIWARVVKREPRCRCDEIFAYYKRPQVRSVDGHRPTCPIVQGHRELLCLECVEALLGRTINLADLRSCVANYHAGLLLERSRL